MVVNELVSVKELVAAKAWLLNELSEVDELELTGDLTHSQRLQSIV
jgi:hypothetical protein